MRVLRVLAAVALVRLEVARDEAEARAAEALVSPEASLTPVAVSAASRLWWLCSKQVATQTPST